MSDIGLKKCDNCGVEFKHKDNMLDRNVKDGATFNLKGIEFTVHSKSSKDNKSRISTTHETGIHESDFCSKECFKKFMMKYIDELIDKHTLEELRSKPNN